ncbi:hypothetical protein BJF78_13500 [Pseudonocardia sp. CNS-139]|nr:hypothetical protein BJF78_13500 [Pseudonocardia sp. CNS-139]
MAGGEVVGLLGPNGSGKSSLLRSVYRSLRPVAGVVRLDEDDVWSLPARESARRTAVVVQQTQTEFDLTVADVVAMGRHPHKRPLERENAQDRELCEDALVRVDMADFAGRSFLELSGGERQRVLIARALAQRSQVLVLDEPTNHLDVHHQFELLDLIRKLGLTTLVAVHDLNLAARYCDRVCVLRAGEVVAVGPPADVLTPALVEHVFAVALTTWTDPETGLLHFGLGPMRSARPTAQLATDAAGA